MHPHSSFVLTHPALSSHTASSTGRSQIQKKKKRKRNTAGGIMADEAEITELRLGPPRGSESGEDKTRKRVFSELADREGSSTSDEGGGEPGGGSVEEPAAKCRVVGWPPVCSYRQRNAAATPGKKKAYVKVGMDGTPFLRKVELPACRGYADLTAAIDRLFGIGGSARNDSDGCDYTQIYEDMEGDWMLVGDVPWVMFVESCRRLRIMKKSEARGFGACS